MWNFIAPILFEEKREMLKPISVDQPPIPSGHVESQIKTKTQDALKLGRLDLSYKANTYNYAGTQTYNILYQNAE